MNLHHFDSLLGPGRGAPPETPDAGLPLFDVTIYVRGLWGPNVTEDEAHRRLADVRRIASDVRRAALPGLRPDYQRFHGRNENRELRLSYRRVAARTAVEATTRAQGAATASLPILKEAPYMRTRVTQCAADSPPK